MPLGDETGFAGETMGVHHPPGNYDYFVTPTMVRVTPSRSDRVIMSVTFVPIVLLAVAIDIRTFTQNPLGGIMGAAFAALLAGWIWRRCTVSVRVDAMKVTDRGILRTRSVPREEIASFVWRRIMRGRGLPYAKCYLILRTGDQVPTAAGRPTSPTPISDWTDRWTRWLDVPGTQ